MAENGRGSSRCEDCGGLWNRPGLSRCRRRKHARPDIAQKIVAEIEYDLTDRRGMGWDNVDENVQEEIRDRWAGIVRRILKRERGK